MSIQKCNTFANFQVITFQSVWKKLPSQEHETLGFNQDNYKTKFCLNVSLLINANAPIML